MTSDRVSHPEWCPANTRGNRDDPFIPPRVAPRSPTLTAVGSPGQDLRRCRICNGPLTVHQEVAGGICETRYCRQQNILRRARDARQRREQEQCRLARRHVENLPLDVRELLPATVHVALVPANDRALTVLPDTRRTAFREHIARCVAGALEPVVGESSSSSNFIDLPFDHDVNEPDAVTLAHACATCRGHCCLGGGEHAYLKSETIKRLLAAGPGLDPDQAVAVYLARLPGTSYQNACVFHSVDGCALPRAMRSRVCNTFLCKSLQSIQDTLDGSPSRTFVAVSMTDDSVKSSALIQEGRLRELWHFIGQGRTGSKDFAL